MATKTTNQTRRVQRGDVVTITTTQTTTQTRDDDKPAETVAPEFRAAWLAVAVGFALWVLFICHNAKRPAITRDVPARTTARAE